MRTAVKPLMPGDQNAQNGTCADEAIGRSGQIHVSAAASGPLDYDRALLHDQVVVPAPRRARLAFLPVIDETIVHQFTHQAPENATLEFGRSVYLDRASALAHQEAIRMVDQAADHV